MLTRSFLPAALLLAGLAHAADDGAQLREARTRLDQAWEMCEHWGGEEAYSEARARDIEEGHARDCGVAADQAKTTLTRFPEDPAIAAIVVDLAAYLGYPHSKQVIADPASAARLCAFATAHYRDTKEGRVRFRGYFEDVCPSPRPPAAP